MEEVFSSGTKKVVLAPFAVKADALKKGFSGSCYQGVYYQDVCHQGVYYQGVCYQGVSSRWARDLAIKLGV